MDRGRLGRDRRVTRHPIRRAHVETQVSLLRCPSEMSLYETGPLEISTCLLKGISQEETSDGVENPRTLLETVLSV